MLGKMSLILLGALMALAMLITTPLARADQANEASQLVLSAPVQIPGNTVLPAGTYWFTVPNESSLNKDLVRIYNADRTVVIATLATVPAMRSETTPKTDLVFAEQSQGRPLALLKWFYPDDTTGHEFVYSPQRESGLTGDQTIDVLAKTAS